MARRDTFVRARHTRCPRARLRYVRAALTSGPTEPTLAAQSCLVAVFTRMHFLSYEPSPTQTFPVRSGGGRSSRVPFAPHRRRVGRIIVSYPLILVP